MTELTSALVASAARGRAGIVTGFVPVWPEARAAGPALTVRGAPDDNLALHRALDAVGAGELIVLDAGDSRAAGLCGELLALSARRRGAAGLVVNGAIRDSVEIAALAFPVFHRGTSPVASRKEEPGELRVPIRLGGVPIEPGDLVVADVDGIAVVPGELVEAVLADVEALAAREEALRAGIEAGESTLDLLGPTAPARPRRRLIRTRSLYMSRVPDPGLPSGHRLERGRGAHHDDDVARFERRGVVRRGHELRPVLLHREHRCARMRRAGLADPGPFEGRYRRGR